MNLHGSWDRVQPEASCCSPPSALRRLHNANQRVRLPRLTQITSRSSAAMNFRLIGSMPASNIEASRNFEGTTVPSYCILAVPDITFVPESVAIRRILDPESVITIAS